MTASRPVLELTDLNVWLRPAGDPQPLHVVRDVSLHLEQGERLGLVGESGCGKSTTLLAILGLLPPDTWMAGSIRLQGRELMEGGRSGLAGLAEPRGREVAMVMQSAMNSLNPALRVERQVVEAMRPARRADKAAARDRCGDLLERVRLPRDAARAFPHELSGGMRQRVGIAIALAAEPRVLLADEPTTALDTVVQARIVELLDELCAELNLAVVLVSHDLALAAQFCDSLAVMYAGHIVEHGTSEGVTSAPAHPYTRMLFAATPRLDAPMQEIRSIPGTPPPLDAPDAGCPFQPRCPFAFEACSTMPATSPAGHSGEVACHLASAERAPA